MSTSSTPTATTGPGASTTSTGSSSAPRAQALDVTEVTHITGHNGAVILERGTVRGTPIGSGTITMQAHVAASGALVDFTVAGPRGTVTGVARVRLTFGKGVIYYSGTAALTHGTGGYRGVSAPHLKVVGHSDLAGTRTVLRVTGIQYL